MPSHAAWAPKASTAATPASVTDPAQPQSLAPAPSRPPRRARTAASRRYRHVPAGPLSLARRRHVYAGRDAAGAPAALPTVCMTTPRRRAQARCSRAGIPRHGRDDPQAGLEGLVETAVLIFGRTRLPPNGARSAPPVTNDGSGVSDHVSVSMPSAPAVRDPPRPAGDSGHEC